MAKSANADTVQRDERGPDYAGALAEIQKILGVEEQAATVRGRVKTNYEAIDNLRVDRKGAMMIKGLLKLEPDNRTIALRSFFGILIAAKDIFEMPGDLVDQMHKAIPADVHVETPGSVRPKGTGTGAKKDTAPVADEPKDDAGEDEDKEDEPVAAAPTPPPVAKKKLAPVPDAIDAAGSGAVH